MTDSSAQPVSRLSRGGARRRRMFTPRDLEVLVLHLLTRGPRHGYELMTEIEARSDFGYAPSPGTMYPALQRLEAAGVIALVSASSSRQRIFALTPQGEDRLANSEATIKRVLAGLQAARPQPPASPGDQIRAAVSRLLSELDGRARDLRSDVEAQIAAEIDDLALALRRRTAPSAPFKEEDR